MTPDQSLDQIVVIVRAVVSGTMTGSAIDKYRVDILWDLGDKLIERGGAEIAGVPDAGQVLAAVKQAGIDAGPTLLKNAVRVRRYWPLKENYQKVADALQTYGKLKDVIQVFDPEKKVPVHELEAFLKFSETATYVDTLERAAAIKQRYIRPTIEGLPDIDTLAESLDAATSLLRRMVESRNQQAISSVQTELTPEKSRALRLLLSALQSPEVYSRYRAQIRTAIFPSPEAMDILGHHDLGTVVRILVPLKTANPTLFPKIVKEIGRPYLGDLATLLKALESPDEQKRYFKNQEVLRRFLNRGGEHGE
jgi:hypothetical protein